MSVVVLLADGVRPDTLAVALDDGVLPALAQLRHEGGLHTISSVFPSVTGPAYAPFLMGRFPGPIGLPGLRWFDRARTACTAPDYTRSYVGPQLRAVDRDIDRTAPTIFELTPSGVASLSVITRGLSPDQQIGRLTPRAALRAAYTHFSGNVSGWLHLDRELSEMLVHRVRDERPAFVFAAFTGVDKASHARGHRAPLVTDALGIVDETAARIRADAERDGRWRDMHLWIVSDHGHSPVRFHEDLAALIATLGYRVVAHPWIFTPRPDVAVMVSGNAMAHVYVNLKCRTRQGWPALQGAWEPLVAALLSRPSIDIALLPHDASHCEVRSRHGDIALVSYEGGRYAYERVAGDALGVGASLSGISADDAYDASASTDYPDAIVQIAHLTAAARAGDIILSATRDWDLRARFEPIPHVSSHGALHREHLLVPLLVSRPITGIPRRTTDIMPSALAALGLPIPASLDGRSFL